MRKKQTPELDQMVVNRLKFGMSKKEIEQELGLERQNGSTIIESIVSTPARSKRKPYTIQKNYWISGIHCIGGMGHVKNDRLSGRQGRRASACREIG